MKIIDKIALLVCVSIVAGCSGCGTQTERTVEVSPTPKIKPTAKPKPKVQYAPGNEPWTNEQLAEWNKEAKAMNQRNEQQSKKQEKSVQSTDKAAEIVSRAIESNKIGVTSADLVTKDNPKGEGVFVYVSQTRFSGVERNIIWMVIDSKAYALNSPSKLVTPSLPWPRDAADEVWAKTNIDKYSGASEAIDILF